VAEFRHVADGVFTVEGLLGSGECDGLVALAEGTGFRPAPIITMFGPVRNDSVRNNTRVMIDDAARAADLWERVAPFVPETLAGRTAVGVNERLRFYRYGPGQAFVWHRDGHFERPSGERSLLTFLVYLNDGFEGGATEFEPDDGGRPFAVTPRKGMALLFPHRLMHQGAPVRSGTKYVLRSDIMYSRPG
jgi:hypothetical protein